MTKKTLTYNEAVSELQAILAELENMDTIDIENITYKTKRAAELITFCKKQLHEIDKELEKVMNELND